MEVYKYSFFAKIIYRYGNIIATPILSIHFISSLIGISEHWYYALFAAINLAVIIVLNNYFISTYKTFPFKITADDKKMVCSNYFFSKKEITIYYNKIDTIEGGFFSGSPTKPIKVVDNQSGLTFNFYSHVGTFNKLLTKILQHVPQEVYNQVLANIKTRVISNKTKKPVK